MSDEASTAPATEAAAPGVSGLLQNTQYGKENVKGVVDKYVDYFDKSKGLSAAGLVCCCFWRQTRACQVFCSFQSKLRLDWRQY